MVPILGRRVGDKPMPDDSADVGQYIHAHKTRRLGCERPTALGKATYSSLVRDTGFMEL